MTNYYLALKKYFEHKRAKYYIKKYLLSKRLANEYLSLIKNKKNLLDPDVSIILPVFNNIEYTISCLYSLSKIKTKYDYEVVIMDDCSTDSTEILIKKIPWVIYCRNLSNLGFLENTNKGAKIAQGEYLVFLNNDTEVGESWLDPLIDRLKEKNVGMVGSKVIYPDGRLQEAGGIVYRDASTSHYGALGLPDSFEYSYSREVDYCSGVSLAIEKELFESLGYFNLLYKPAYYEDTDLAFKVREYGLKVVYEPRSTLIHHESVSHGTATKKLLETNKIKFLNNWRAELSERHYKTNQFDIKARDRSSRLLALLIIENKHSSSHKTISFMAKAIKNQGYKVTIWPTNNDNILQDFASLQNDGIELAGGDMTFYKFTKQRGIFYDLVIIDNKKLNNFKSKWYDQYPNADIRSYDSFINI